jgi:hypothetical protein
LAFFDIDSVDEGNLLIVDMERFVKGLLQRDARRYKDLGTRLGCLTGLAVFVPYRRQVGLRRRWNGSQDIEALLVHQ